MNLKAGFLIIAVFFLFIASAQAQDKKKKKKNKKAVQEQPVKSQDNAFRPHIPEEYKTTDKKSRKRKESFTSRYNRELNNKVEEFYDRLEANAKRDKKIRRKMEHPQYSDFSYFGHKKKPKIRPVGKRKFCKECGIVH